VCQTPQWTDAVCASGRHRDASRLYELSDGRRFVLPLVRLRRWPGPSAPEASFPPAWGIGGLVGWLQPEVFAGLVTEVAIALSVMLLGGGIAWGRAIPTPLAMAAVAFFGFFHGYAHGSEIPDIADTLVYAVGFLLGTILLHLTGVLIGEVAKRYQYGLLVLRGAGVAFVVIGASFFLEAI